LGARIAEEKLGVPTATVHLQPTVIRSLIDQGLMGGMRIAGWQPAWFKQGFFRFIDWALIDRLIGRPLNDFRSTLGLRPVARVMHRWMHSPQLVIGFFPDWFAAPQADWPARTHLVGFPMWDGGGGEIPMPPDAEEFLDAGEPPLIFTPGSAGSTMHRFFEESIEAARRLGKRAMLVTNFPEQIAARLPARMRTFGYLPFSRALPRAALLVHHGGIGTLAQAVKSGIPQLIVPNGHDQFDNGWRIERLGLGRSIPQTRYRAGLAMRTIRTILDDPRLAGRAQSYAARIDGAAALTRAAELIEALAAQAPTAPAAAALVG
jgi:UDP:flavonoid glycosyltransferase YjiC (YdhE family)